MARKPAAASSVAPTRVARAFAEEVSLSFDRLVTAAEESGGPAAPRVLRVSAPTTFAMHWLIPRLDRFHRLRPEADVVVSTTATLHEELRGGFDVAIRRRGTSAAGSSANTKACYFALCDYEEAGDEVTHQTVQTSHRSSCTNPASDHDDFKPCGFKPGSCLSLLLP